MIIKHNTYAVKGASNKPQQLRVGHCLSEQELNGLLIIFPPHMLAHFCRDEVILAGSLFCGFGHLDGCGCLKGLSVISVQGKMGDLNHCDYAGIIQPSGFLLHIKSLFPVVS